MSFKYTITKYTNLDANDSLSAINGHACQQHHNVYSIFYNLINKEQPDRILEIGTSLGGFTAYLHMLCKDLRLNTYIRSYDIHSRPWFTDLINQGVDIRIKNVFYNNYTIIDDSIKKMITEPGKIIILCDGGNKIGEFNVLSPYLKKDDLIMAHDYASDKEYFQQHIRNKIWNWHEIQDSDIIDSCQNYGLVPYMREEFLNVAWACFKKE